MNSATRRNLNAYEEHSRRYRNYENAVNTMENLKFRKLQLKSLIRNNPNHKRAINKLGRFKNTLKYSLGSPSPPWSPRQFRSVIKNKLNQLGKQKVDLVIGGPPCQAYSVAGRARDPKGMSEDPRNHLYGINIQDNIHNCPQ